MSKQWVRSFFQRLWTPTRGRAERRSFVRSSRPTMEMLEQRLTPSGTPPTALPIPRQMVFEDAAPVTLNLADYFSDPEMDTLTYSVVQTNTTGLVTPTVTNANLELAFAPNQYGYSYFRVTANDGSNTTTAAFEVIVRAVDDLVNDIASTIKDAPVTISVRGNDGAPDTIWQVEAGNMNLVQNSTANTSAAITLSFPQSTPNMFVNQTSSDRGDYHVRVGSSASDDVASGQLFSTVRQNGRNNGEGGNLAGTRYTTSHVAVSGTSYFIPVHDSPRGSEYNVNVATAYFPYSHGWLAGFTGNVNNTEGAVNDVFRTVSPDAGFTIGLTESNTVQDLGGGQLRVKIPGVSSQTDGLLLALGARNEANYALSKANPDGSWQVYVRDGGNQTADYEVDPAAFVYIPKDAPNIVSGRIVGNAAAPTVQLGSGDFTITKTGTGTWTLTITGQSPTTGVLLLSPEGGGTNNVDNIVSYQASGNSFIIQSRDVVISPTQGALEDPVDANEPAFSFAFIPFLSVPASRVASVQSLANGPNTSDLGATLTLNADGTVNYNPNTSTTIQALTAGQSAIDSFTYTTTTLTGQTTTATVNVNVAFSLSNLVDLIDGVLSITSTPGVVSDLSVGFDGSNYTFSDTATFYLTPAAQAVFAGDGTTTFTGSAALVSSIVINTNDLDDTITLHGIGDGFTIAGGGQSLDTVVIAGDLNFTGDASISGVNSINATGGAKIITPTGAVTLSAADNIGSTGTIRTRAATVTFAAGAGGATLIEDDGADVSGTVSGAGNLSVTNLGGTLNIAGAMSTVSGTLTLSSDDALTLGGNLSAGSGTISISANTDGDGSEGFDQQTASLTTSSTSATAVTITVNTNGSGTGDAILGRANIGNTTGGTIIVNANGGDILWSSSYVVPDIGTSNANVIAAHSYVFTTNGVDSAVGASAAPIQTNNHVNLGTANLTAGTGGIYMTDWGDFDLVIASAIAQGSGDIQLIAANAGGHNLSVMNATTGSGNIVIIADDSLYIGTLDGPTAAPGFLGGPSFSGTISLLANRDGANEQIIIMRPGSVIQTSNTSADAVLMRTQSTDNSPTNVTLGGVTITSVITGDGGTVTIDTAWLPNFRGRIIQQDDTTVGIDVGPTGTAVLKAWNELNGVNPAVGAGIGDALNPIRINAGFINITSINTPVYVNSTLGSSFTATVTADPIASVANATVLLKSEAGVLTIGGATHTDGGAITLNGAAGVTINAPLGDANSGNITVNSLVPTDVVVTSDLIVYAGKTLTINDANAAQLGPVTTVQSGGVLVAANGVELATGDTLQGQGTVNATVTAMTGSFLSPGTSPGILTTGNVALDGTLVIELNGATAGSGHDQLVSNGSVDLDGATLDVHVNFTPADQSTFTIIDSATGVTGTLSNTFPLNAGIAVFSINYAGGLDGFDVVLTVENLRPTAAFTPVSPNPRNNALASAALAFSEAIVGFDAADLVLTRNGDIVPLTGVTVTGTGPYTIEGLETLTSDLGAYVLTLVASGSGIEDSDSTPGQLFGNASVSWIVSDNEAPTLDATGSFSLTEILEDATANPGNLVSQVIASAGGDRITDINVDPEGIAVTAVDDALGTWQFSIDNGTTWAAIGPVSNSSARLLGSDSQTRVRFVPNTDFIGSVPAGLTFRAWDQSTGSNGGLADTSFNGSTASYSAATDTASIYVISVPDALTANFRNGLNGYTGTADTMLSQAAPDMVFGLTDPFNPETFAPTGLFIDFSNTEAVQALLRFSDLFGDGEGQIPLGSIIVSATLTLNTLNTGHGGAFYRLNTTWDEATETWNTFGNDAAPRNATGGVQANGVEARRSYEAFAGPPSLDQLTSTGRTVYGVTSDLQAWANGEANNGWAILPWNNGTDGWSFQSSEADDGDPMTPEENEIGRPTLTVSYLPAGSVSVARLRQGENGYTGAVDTDVRQGDPNANRSTQTGVSIDFNSGANDEVHGLIRFNNLFGNSPTAIPAGAIVSASTLQLTSTAGSSPGAGGTFNRMLVDWTAPDSWNSFGNGADGRNLTTGIQADGAEAAVNPTFQAGSLSLIPLAQATTMPFNATADVQAWANGTGNYGWGALPFNQGDNMWSFDSSEAATAANRPQLTVYYNAPEREHSIVDILSGALTFTAGGGADGLGIANQLTVSLSGDSLTYTLTDPTDIIILTQAAIDAGWSGSGTHTVTGSNASVSSLTINTGTRNDAITIDGVDDPISVNGGFSGGDTLDLAGAIHAAGSTVSLFGFASITQSAVGTAINVDGGILYLSADSIGTPMNRLQIDTDTLYLFDVRTAAWVDDADSVPFFEASTLGAGSIDVATLSGELIVTGAVRNQAGSVTLQAATNLLVNATVGNTPNYVATGNITLTAQTGDLTIGAAVNTAGGNIVLSAGNAVHLNVDLGNTGTTTGTIAINANTDATGSEGFIQAPFVRLFSANTTSGAAAITVAGEGNALIGSGSIAGTFTISAANILWGEVVDPLNGNHPETGGAPATLRAEAYEFTTTSPTGAIGSALAPIQTDALSDTATANLAADAGGVFFTDWGGSDLTITSASATGAGDIQLIAADASGSNLTIANVTAETGNIFISVNDTLTITGAIGGGSFNGTVTALANRDGGNESRIEMEVGSAIVTTNATPNAVRLSIAPTDDSVSSEAIGGITVAQITVGNGGTITIDAADATGKQGNIVQPTITTTLDAGAAGTVVLNATNLQNGSAPANGAAIGTPTNPIRVNAGTVQITAVNTPVNVATLASANVTASLTAVGANTTLAGATLTLLAETGALTIAGATSAPGAAIQLTAPDGVIVNAQLGNATDGAIAITGPLSGSATIAAGVGPVSLTQETTSTFAGVITGGASVTKSGSGALTLTGENLYSGGTTVAGGQLLAENLAGSATGSGAVLVNANTTFGGNGAVAGPVTVNGTLAPGPVDDALAVNSTLALTGVAAFDITPDSGPLASADQIDGVTTLTYGGVLRIVPSTGDSFAAGDSWKLFDFTSQSGIFANVPVFGTFGDGVNLPNLDANLIWMFDYATGILSVEAFTFVAPSVTSLTPVVGPTTGGTLVSIIGENFVGTTTVTFDGIAATTFTVISATQIIATSPSHVTPAAVDVVVANPAGSGSLDGDADFTYATPAVASIAVNAGPGVVLGGSTWSLAGQSSVVKQILVTFNQAVTVASDAFTVVPVPVSPTPNAGPGFVSVAGGAAPSPNAATTSVTMISSSVYLVTFVDDSADPTPSTHANGILNSGVYDLTTIAGKVTANGETMASNRVDTFFAMFGTVDANNTYSPGTIGDGASKAFVDPGSLFQFSDAFGSNVTNPAGPPAYDIVFDSNLDGAIDPGDLFAFSDSFGMQWVF